MEGKRILITTHQTGRAFKDPSILVTPLMTAAQAAEAAGLKGATLFPKRGEAVAPEALLAPLVEGGQIVHAVLQP